MFTEQCYVIYICLSYVTALMKIILVSRNSDFIVYTL